MKSTPTLEQHTAFQFMFDHFNEALFDGELPQVVLSFTRRPRVAGHFGAERWNRDANNERAHEICVNPSEFRNPTSAAQTIVHEMVHLWQHTFGKPARVGYHDREFAKKMKEVGLQPSTTGKEGGKETGQSMSDYPIKGGRFLAALKALPKRASVPWSGVPEAEKPTKGASTSNGSSKSKFTCPSCEANAWGKPTLNLICGDCDEEMEIAS